MRCRAGAYKAEASTLPTLRGTAASISSRSRFWSIGQADNSFNSGGGKLLFVPNTTNSSSATVAFTNAGRVGIGTTNPSQLLHVNSGNGNAAALVQTPSGAFAQYQLQSGATSPWIVGTQDNFAGNALLFRNGSTDLVTIQPSGNVMQPLDKGGFVKAMLYVSSGGNIHQCYNGKTGASASGIGTTKYSGGNGGDYSAGGWQGSGSGGAAGPNGVGGAGASGNGGNDSAGGGGGGGYRGGGYSGGGGFGGGGGGFGGFGGGSSGGGGASGGW